jgi:hypothetical protein
MPCGFLGFEVQEVIMATGNNQAFYVETLKALKMAGEQSPFGSDERKIYSTKANALRETLKKMGYANVDADYGAGVALKDTPGGGKIDWNVLTNAADTLSTTQAGSTRSAFDRALGEYLTRNLPVWQKQSATSTPSAAVTSTTTPVMGGGSAAAGITGGNIYDPTHPLTPTAVGGPPSVAQGGVQVDTTNPTPTGGVPQFSQSNPTPTGGEAQVQLMGMGTSAGSGTEVYGDFIKSEYFKNNDFDGYFLSVNKGLNLPTLTDPTTGKVTIDWANKTTPISVSVFNSYGNMTKLWNTLQGLSKEKDTFNSLDIEKNPVFKEQLNVLDAEMQSLQKQFNLNVDAQLEGLKGSVEANKAGLEYELTTIKREIGASNWRSRQSLAASGMAFSGMLGYLYGQNEAKGTDAAIKATSISAAEIRAIGAQMAILEGSKLSYSSDLERLYGGKRALARATILDPQNGRLEEIGKLIDQGIADFTTEQGLVAPAAEVGRRAEVAAAQTANYETAVELAKLDKQGIWLKQDASGNWTWQTGLTDAEQTTRDSALFDQWYKTEGLNLDWANLDLDKDKLVLDQAKQKFSEWATTQGLNLDSAKLDLEWAKLVETVRSNKAGEAGGTGGTYDPKNDLALVNSAHFMESVQGSAPYLRLAASSGAGTSNDGVFGVFLNGTPDAKNALATTIIRGIGHIFNKNITVNPDTAVPGALSLPEADFLEVVNLIKDPIRQGEAVILYYVKNGLYKTAVEALDAYAADNKWTPEQVAAVQTYLDSLGG